MQCRCGDVSSVISLSRYPLLLLSTPSSPPIRPSSPPNRTKSYSCSMYRRFRVTAAPNGCQCRSSPALELVGTWRPKHTYLYPTYLHSNARIVYYRRLERCEMQDELPPRSRILGTVEGIPGSFSDRRRKSSRRERAEGEEEIGIVRPLR